MRPNQTAGGGGVGAWIYYGDNAEDFGELTLFDKEQELRMWSISSLSINYPDTPNTFYIYQYRDSVYDSTAE